MTENKQHITDVINSLGLTMTTVFVPWSRSRNAGEKYPSLNWLVTIKRNGREVLTTDYSAGCGHCPSYKQHENSVDYWNKIKNECEYGKRSIGAPAGKRSLEPDMADVLHSLLDTSEALEHSCFESWADEFGYDSDSREAEATYKQYLDIGLKLRAAIGDTGLAKLREAFQDY